MLAYIVFGYMLLAVLGSVVYFFLTLLGVLDHLLWKTVERIHNALGQFRP